MSHNISVFIFELKDVIFAENKRTVRSHRFFGIAEEPPAPIVGAGRHKAVLVVGILEIVEQERTAFFGERTGCRLFTGNRLQVSARRILMIGIRNEHQAKHAFGK